MKNKTQYNIDTNKKTKEKTKEKQKLQLKSLQYTQRLISSIQKLYGWSRSNDHSNFLMTCHGYLVNPLISLFVKSKQDWHGRKRNWG